MELLKINIGVACLLKQLMVIFLASIPTQDGVYDETQLIFEALTRNGTGGANFTEKQAKQFLRSI